jgi:AraC-like DNA-binding protein
MHEASSLPELLSADQQAQADEILGHSEIVLLSCFFWRSSDPIGLRRLRDSLLHVQVKGHLRWRIGAAEHRSEPGTVVMVPDGVEHEAHLEPGDDHSEAFSLHAHAYTARNRPLLELLSSPVGTLPGAEGWFQQLALLTHLIGRDPDKGRCFGEPLVRGLLLQQILHGNPLTEVPSACDPRIWLAGRNILQQFASPLTVEGLAREAGLGLAQFRRLFRRHMGASPKAYIQDIRLRKARALLQTDPALSIKEVAERTGFGDPHYLHAVFRQKYGITPAACRAEAEPHPPTDAVQSPAPRP